MTAWLTDVVGSLRLGSVGDISSVRERPWGAVLRVTTADQVVYFKADGLGAHHEPVVIAGLARAWRDLVPEVLAADDARSWLVMADHGAPMWDVLDPAGQLACWEKLLPLYAQMQASTIGSVPAWVEAGAPDRRMSRLPELLDSLLAGEMTGGNLPIDAERRRAIDVVLPDLARVCDDVATTPFAAALDHGDLHGGNVLVRGNRQRLVDWGDSCVTHPFSSLFVTYELVVSRFGRAERPAAVRRLRDAYLEGWSEFGSPVSLRETFRLAVWAGYVCRALDFVHMLKDATAGLIEEWHRHIVVTLRHWQEAHALLGQGEELLLAIEP